MIWLLLILFVPGGLNQIALFPLCGEHTNIFAIKEPPGPGPDSLYVLEMRIPLWAKHLKMYFDADVSLSCDMPTNILFVERASNKSYVMRFSPDYKDPFAFFILKCRVLVPNTYGYTVPYVQSIVLDNKHELCDHPTTGYLDQDYAPNEWKEKPENKDFSPFSISNVKAEHTDSIQGNSDHLKENIDVPDRFPSTMSNKNSQSEDLSPRPDKTCGRQKIAQNPLIVHGQATKPGHWPWHVAIYRSEKFSHRYICGGTLLSKTLVLTAAHCAAIRSSAIIPEALRIGLGKHNLFDEDERVQQREVFQVIIHPKFNVGAELNNDIALLKLKSEAVFTEYVQPACLWYAQATEKLPSGTIFGTVAGWGFDHQDTISNTLQQITIPIVSELTCVRNTSSFFNQNLNINKFCAGFANGTSLCNGDSGGGLMIYVTETPGGTASGAWHVRGIVSAAPIKNDKNVCDPDQYTIFTDVEKYRDWVLRYLN